MVSIDVDLNENPSNSKQDQKSPNNNCKEEEDYEHWKGRILQKAYKDLEIERTQEKEIQ